MVGLKNKIYLITFCSELPCDFHIHFEMWFVFLKRGDYFEDIPIKGWMEMHLEGIFVGCVDCILLVLRRYKRLDVLNTQNKPNMP